MTARELASRLTWSEFMDWHSYFEHTSKPAIEEPQEIDWETADVSKVFNIQG